MLYTKSLGGSPVFCKYQEKPFLHQPFDRSPMALLVLQVRVTVRSEHVSLLESELQSPVLQSLKNK